MPSSHNTQFSVLLDFSVGMSVPRRVGSPVDMNANLASYQSFGSTKTDGRREISSKRECFVPKNSGYRVIECVVGFETGCKLYGCALVS